MLSRQHAGRVTRVKGLPISAKVEPETRAALTGTSHRPHAAAMSKTVINLKEATELQRLNCLKPVGARPPRFGPAPLTTSWRATLSRASWKRTRRPETSPDRSGKYSGTSEPGCPLRLRGAKASLKLILVRPMMSPMSTL